MLLHSPHRLAQMCNFKLEQLEVSILGSPAEVCWYPLYNMVPRLYKRGPHGTTKPLQSCLIYLLLESIMYARNEYNRQRLQCFYEFPHPCIYRFFYFTWQWRPADIVWWIMKKSFMRESTSHMSVEGVVILCPVLPSDMVSRQGFSKRRSKCPKIKIIGMGSGQLIHGNYGAPIQSFQSWQDICGF